MTFKAKDKNKGNDGESQEPKKASKPFIDPKAVYDVNAACAILNVNSREVSYMKRKHSDKVITIIEWQDMMRADDMMFTELVKSK